MKAKKLPDIKSSYNFEAPVLPAAVKSEPGAGSLPACGSMDLNKQLAPEPRETFLVRVNGESMINRNIFDGDILIVNSRELPADGKIVVAALNGEMAVKTYRVIDGEVYLYSANEKFLPIRISPFMEFQIQGVVRYVIHNV